MGWAKLPLLGKYRYKNALFKIGLSPIYFDISSDPLAPRAKNASSGARTFVHYVCPHEKGINP